MYEEEKPLLKRKQVVEKGALERFGARHALGFWSFLGFINLFTVRVNLSVSLVAMVNTTSPWSINTSNSECDDTNSSNKSLVTSYLSQNGAEFNWDEQTQGYILGAFFYGYCTTQVMGGWLAGKLGGKLLFGLGILIPSVLSLVIPLAARFNLAALIALRVCQGVAQGVVYPAMHSLWANWAPVLERSKLVAVTYAGAQLGIVAAMLGTGYLCQSNFLGGWPAVFYIFGSAGCIWSIGWFLFVHDTPAQHPRISQAEREYIERSTRKHTHTPTPPWLSIAKSSSFWAIVAAHVANDWCSFTTITCLPQYMREVLKFDISKDGFLSSLPYMCLWVINTICGPIADRLRSGRYLSTKNTRKFMNSLGLFPPVVFMILVGFSGCNSTLAVLFLCLGVGFSGFTLAGYSVNHLDIAPPFAGILMGLTNTFGTTTGFIGPAIVGALTNHNPSMGQWRIFFFLTAGIFLVGGIIFAIFAEGEEKEWSLEASLNTRLPNVLQVQDNEEDIEEVK